MSLREDEIGMSKAKYRKPAPRKYQDHRGLPQMIVKLSALPEFGGRAVTLTWAYKFSQGEGVSERLLSVLKEAKRRLGLTGRGA